MKNKPLLEREFLGAVLINGAFDPRPLGLAPEDFTPGFPRMFWTGVVAVLDKGAQIDPVTIMLECGCAATDISALMNETSGSANVEHYGKELQHAILSQKKKDFKSHAAKLILEGQDPKEVAAKAETAMVSVMARFKKGNCSGGGTLAAEKLLDLLINPHKIPLSLETGISPIDKMCVGLIGGDMVILAARPSVGKTALALQISVNLSLKEKRVMYFSYEMGGVQLANRVLGSISGNNTRQVLRGASNMSETQRSGLITHASPLLKAMKNIEILDRSGMTLNFMRTAAREFAVSGGVLIVVDHIGLIPPENCKLSKREQVSQCSIALKSLARELSLPIIAISQLNRECESQKRAPQLSDLRDSGDLEQDADYVWIMSREEAENPSKILFHQAKGRDVGIDQDVLFFDTEHQIFQVLERNAEP